MLVIIKHIGYNHQDQMLYVVSEGKLFSERCIFKESGDE